MSILPLHLLSVPLILLSCAVARAQSLRADTTKAGDTVATLRIGPTFRSAEIDLLVGAGGLNIALFTDVDLVRLGGSDPLGLGLRAGAERAVSIMLLDYGYTDYHIDLMARATIANKWVRLDLYGGYVFLSHSYAGFNISDGTRNYHLLNLGMEYRVLFVPNVFGLLFRYSVAGNGPIGGEKRTFKTGGLGLTLGWSP